MSMILRPDLVRGSETTGQATPSRVFNILYKETDELWEMDGYRVGPFEAPDDAAELSWTFHLTCPKCKNNLLLDSQKKKVSVWRDLGIESERFACAHPAEFGGICGHGLVLEIPRKREDRTVVVAGRIIKVDAVARRA